MKRPAMNMRQEHALVSATDPGGELADPQVEPDHWFRAAPVETFASNLGACVEAADTQIAVFNFTRRGEWFACRNLCPHERRMILSRGTLGSAHGEPRLTCPAHGSTFSLQTGRCLNGDLESLRTYPVRVEDGYVYIDLGS